MNIARLRRTNPFSVLKNVAITGGTHGNELSGIYMVQNFLRNPTLIKRSSFEACAVASNVEATKLERRYVDVDMNRCFLLEDLEKWKKSDEESLNVEQARAVILDELLGPKASQSPSTDFIFDLHNSTANTGRLLCFHEDDDFAFEVAAYLKSCDPQITAVHWPSGDVPFLPTVARSGMTVEVGPVAHSTLKTAIYNKTKDLISNALDYIDLHNDYVLRKGDDIKKVKIEVPMAVRLCHVPYPRNNSGNITAFIHDDLQGIKELQNGSTITEGCPIFQTLNGETIKFEPGEYNLTEEDMKAGIYPMFVNEAAYYEKDVAFYLTKRIHKTGEYLVREEKSKI
eukprot:CAMPEP_0204823186 /NCGR_PEP_ID=MMETSP1346-20131115/1285_1 /ASSEMBLY_ACC=CAM_ASM_000771 /TAXON_ID=215587 /ORGANISM="Aplanochytrium stocchinoi, Strain GSBS06" /LENGTH=340 /DNA_ID=CAMNT_0051949735 /DNA_START=125 /DNA_END=1147 /DNA_ORIENTATION=+